MRPLTQDPPADLIQWAKNSLRANPEILAAYLFERIEAGDQYRLTLGIDLVEDVRLADRQKVFKAVSSTVSGTVAENVQLLLLNSTTRLTAEKVGLRIYQKKTA